MPFIQNQALKGISCPLVPTTQLPSQQVVVRGQIVRSGSLSSAEASKCFNISRTSRDRACTGLRSGMRGMVTTKAAGGEQHKVARRMSEAKEQKRCV